MSIKARDYQAKAKRNEQLAKKVRDPDSREWRMTLARAYLMLAEAEAEPSALLERKI
jgi:hypothetical protein